MIDLNGIKERSAIIFTKYVYMTFSFFFSFFLIGGQLLYNVVVVSVVN